MSSNAPCRLDTVEVMQATATLLKGHKKLLKQFNTFLPENYRIEWLPPELTNYQSFYGTTTLPSAQRALQLASSFVDRTVVRCAGTTSHALLTRCHISSTIATGVGHGLQCQLSRL
eukprot:142440-Pleurochrysis_carterae.AAC.1